MSEAIETIKRDASGILAAARRAQAPEQVCDIIRSAFLTGVLSGMVVDDYERIEVASWLSEELGRNMLDASSADGRGN